MDVAFIGLGQMGSGMADNLVATGFLRMRPDPTWANI
ncbi:MAG: NAD(P)-dependent oxidoreductase, partial [Salinicola sp.]|nr:NAD(P)-dependent oxidoreductase [Salinicola sp.]